MVFAKDNIKQEVAMCHYKHLTLIEREKLMFFLAKHYPVSQIAIFLSRNRSTIYREIRRNSKEQYIPVKAQNMYEQRRKACKPKNKLANLSLLNIVRDKIINHNWSPEQISGRLAEENNKNLISYNTIYRAIYKGLLNVGTSEKAFHAVLHKLRHHGKKRHSKNYEERRGKIIISNNICDRPLSAEQRSCIGHWESDTMLGKLKKACLVTMVDRKSRFLCGGKAQNKEAGYVNQVMILKLSGMPLRSITPDRGHEFAKHREVSKALGNVPFYFPLPHHPWQKGTVENINGLLREFFPKGKDLTDITDDYVQKIFDELNLRPRKCLNFRTPFEVFYSKSLHLV